MKKEKAIKKLEDVQKMLKGMDIESLKTLHSLYASEMVSGTSKDVQDELDNAKGPLLAFIHKVIFLSEIKDNIIERLEEEIREQQEMKTLLG